MTSSDPDLDTIEARADAATPGPWQQVDFAEIKSPDGELIADYWEPSHVSENGAFITHARTDVPALVAEVRRLRAELATERQQHKFTMRQRNNRGRRLLHLRDLAKAGDPNVLAAAALDTLAASVDDHLGGDERAAVVPAAGVTGE